jgi:hypothetical protein
MAFKDLFKKKDKKAAPAADKSFGETFKAERKKQGADGIFTWKGKKYTTKFKEEVGLKKSPVPKPRPEKPTEPVAKTPPPAPKAKDDGPSVAKQVAVVGGIGAGVVAGGKAYSRFKGRGSRLSLPKPSASPTVAANSSANPRTKAKYPRGGVRVLPDGNPNMASSPANRPRDWANRRLAKGIESGIFVDPNAPAKPKGGANPKSVTRPVTTQNAATPKANPRASVATNTDAAPKAKANPPKPKAKIKPRAVRSKPVITRTSTPKVVNVKMKPRVTRPAPKVVADRVAASKTPTVTKTVELPKPKASTTGTSLVKKTGTDVAKIVPKSTTLSKIGQGALSVLKNPLVRFGLSAPVAGTIEALRPTQMGDGERTNVNQKPSSQADMMKDVNAAAAAKEAKANAPTSSRGPRGETSSEMRGKGYGWDQSSKSWKKTQQSENRTEMNRGGMVKKMSSGGSIARGGGAAKRGTKFKGSF